MIAIIISLTYNKGDMGDQCINGLTSLPWLGDKNVTNSKEIFMFSQISVSWSIWTNIMIQAANLTDADDWQAQTRVPMILYAYGNFRKLSEKNKLGKLGDSVLVKVFLNDEILIFSLHK